MNKMASNKFAVFISVALLLNCHWAKAQYIGGYSPSFYNNDDDDLDALLPIVILALLGRGGGFGGYGGGFGGYGGGFGGYGGGCGGYGGGCGGCGGGCGGGYNGGCGCGC